MGINFVVSHMTELSLTNVTVFVFEHWGQN